MGMYHGQIKPSINIKRIVDHQLLKQGQRFVETSDGGIGRCQIGSNLVVAGTQHVGFFQGVNGVIHLAGSAQGCACFQPGQRPLGVKVCRFSERVESLCQLILFVLVNSHSIRNQSVLGCPGSRQLKRRHGLGPGFQLFQIKGQLVGGVGQTRPGLLSFPGFGEGGFQILPFAGS